MSYILGFYRGNVWFRWFLWLVIILPGIPFVLVTIAYLFFLLWPRDFSPILDTVNISSDTRYVSVSSHGVKDSSASWSDGLQTVMAGRSPSSAESRAHLSIDWRPHSDSAFICSVMARRIGRQIGEKIASTGAVQHIHAIGHSCGAFMALGICEGARSQSDLVAIQTTYLDPVSIYAGFFWDYGISHFGSCADFSDAYIDTADTVPGSNQLLPNTHTFDISQVRLERNPDEHPHNWPPQFYIEEMQRGSVPQFVESGEKLWIDYPKGELEKIDR